MRPCPKPEPRPKKFKPACKCGKPSAWYGPVGGYSVACIDCNRKNATRQRLARKGLKRSWMRRKAPRRLRREGSDKAYLVWLHTQPCCYAPWCKDGPIEAAHHRDMTGLGRKEDDSKAIPLCRSHHRQFDGHYGAFLLAEKEQRKLWFLAMIARTQEAYRGGKLEEETGR